MRKFDISILLILIYLVAAENVIAHVDLDYPKRDETFVTGETVVIKWIIVQEHPQNNWDLFFSSNSGNNWEEIELDIDVSRLLYIWTVPEILTENARIRIVQDNTGTNYEDSSGDFIITDTQTSIEILETNPTAFTLHDNYPNPFNPATTISYELSGTSDVELTIYDQLGKVVRTLVKGQQHANYYQIHWDGRNTVGKQVVSGVYVYRLKVDTNSQARKMMLLR